MAKKPYIIALEEHYLDPEVRQLGGPGAGRDIVERLHDLGRGYDATFYTTAAWCFAGAFVLFLVKPPRRVQAA